MRVALKRLAMSVLLCFASSLLWSASFSITVGTWSLPSDNPVLEAATRGYLGFTTGLTPRLEFEVFTLLQATPIPLADIHGGGALTFTLTAARELPEEQATSFLHTYLSFGVLQGLRGSDSTAVFFRLTPLSIGGPYYKIRER
ncbi:MAG: hypothetical protein CVV52_01040, partial [Spirochaetae bacterium HGW-Spirochaetae-8]